MHHFAALHRAIGSPAWPEDEAALLARVQRRLQRSYRPRSTARQAAAVLVDGDRSSRLARLQVPTLVIHGAEDPLVPAAAGRDLARRIPGAELEVVAGMGHDLPAPLWPCLAARMHALALRGPRHGGG